jgi:hypothetical protein
MTRTTDILQATRDILADHDADRWGNDVLIRRLNEGLKDIATETQLFRAYADIQLVLNQAEYDVPADLIILKAGFVNDEEIEIISTDKAEQQFGRKWRIHTTESFIEKLVFNQLTNNKIRVYPIPRAYPAGTTIDQDLFGIFDSMVFEDTEVSFSSTLYGIVDVLTYIEDNFLELSTEDQLYGIAIIDLITSATAIRIYYTRYLADVTVETTNFDLNKAFDKALAHYIAGTSLRTSIDVQNRAYGDEELNFYSRHLAKLSQLSAADAVSNKHFSTRYNGMGS